MRCEVLHLKDSFPALAQAGRDPLLTAYLPDNLIKMGRANQKHPCLLVCPGGGYEYCSERESEPIALHFLPDGFRVFVLNYSCVPHSFPSQLCEVAAAMELIAQNADLWNCDASRVAIMGFSAGGHLAAHYTNTYACAEVRTLFPESKPVQASILCYPVITADPKWTHHGSMNHLTGKTAQTPEEIERLSCDKLVSAQTPPTFLWHTATDSAVPVMNALLYAQALSAQNVPFEMHVYPCGDHGLATSDIHTLAQVLPEHEYVHAWLPCVKAWLRRQFPAQTEAET